MRIQDASKIKILKCSLTREASNNRCYRRRRRRRWHHERRMLIIVNLHGRDTTPAAGLVRGEFFSWCATFRRRRRRCASFFFLVFFFKLYYLQLIQKYCDWLWLKVLRETWCKDRERTAGLSSWATLSGIWTRIFTKGMANVGERRADGAGRRWVFFFNFYFKCLFCSGWSFDFHARLVVFTFISLGS